MAATCAGDGAGRWAIVGLADLSKDVDSDRVPVQDFHLRVRTAAVEVADSVCEFDAGAVVGGDAEEFAAEAGGSEGDSD